MHRIGLSTALGLIEGSDRKLSSALTKYLTPGGRDPYKPARRSMTRVGSGIETVEDAVRSLKTLAYEPDRAINLDAFRAVHAEFIAQGGRYSVAPSGTVPLSTHFELVIQPNLLVTTSGGKCSVIDFIHAKTARLSKQTLGVGVLLLKRALSAKVREGTTFMLIDWRRGVRLSELEIPDSGEIIFADFKRRLNSIWQGIIAPKKPDGPGDQPPQGGRP